MTERDLFFAALDLPAPERAPYLDSACQGDTALRERVERLLRSHNDPGSFLNLPGTEEASTRAFDHPADDATRTQGHLAQDDEEDAIGFLTPSPRADALGRIGHYDVLEVLGKGGFGIVYRAFDDVLQRVVAVKVLAPSMAATSPARKRFLREARSAAPIQHEHVVRIHETGETPLPFLVMEYVPGETLQQHMDRTGPLEVPEALKFARQIAAGLAAAHEKGLIHRDIKPSNVLIDAGPHQAKISDFGLARAADDASLTRSGVVAGTPMYMAPEQARGEQLDQRADLFSLGSVLYAMLTGRPPFRAENTPAVLKRVAEDTPRPIREIMPEVPEWLCRIVEKLHAKNAADRFQTAKEVAELLADCEKQLETHKALVDYSRIPGGKPAKKSKRWQWAAVVAGVAALLVGGLVVGIASLNSTEHGVLWVHNLGKYDYTDAANGTVYVRNMDTKDVIAIRLPPGQEARSLDPGTYEVVGATIGDGKKADLQVSLKQFMPGDRDAQNPDPVSFTLARGQQLHLYAIVKPLSLPPDPPSPPPADGFLPLFNRKDLSGWKKHPRLGGFWHVDENGVLIGTGPSEAYLATQQGDYENFHLKMEVLVDSATSDSGVFLRVPFPNFENSVEVNISFDPKQLLQPTGSVLIHRAGAAQSQVRKAPVKLAEVGQWFTLEILAQGDEVRTLVNGKPGVTTQVPGSSRRGHIMLQQVGEKATVRFRKIEIKQLPASTPAVPKTAAEVLPFLAGNWKVEVVRRSPQLPPDKAPFVWNFAFDFVADGKFLRGRSSVMSDGSELHDLWSFDLSKGAMRRWIAKSDTGFYGPNVGLFNPDNRTLTMSTRIGDADAIHQYEFADADTIYHRFFLKDEGGAVTREVHQKWTRAGGPSALTHLLPDPNRPAEMKILDRMVGEWHNEQTVTDAATPDQPKRETFRVKAESILGGRFIEEVVTNDTTGASNYTLAWFDPAAKHYRRWFFSGAGPVTELTGTWDDTKKTLTWNSTDNAVTVREVLKSDYRHEFHLTFKDGGGEPVTETAGFARRIREANPPPPAVAPFDTPQAKEHQEQWAKHLGVSVEFVNSGGMALRLIPPGRFVMGSPDTEPGRLADRESPAHPVTIDTPFYLGTFEVTQEQYTGVTGADPKQPRTGKDNPISSVSFEEAVEFCRRLSEFPEEKKAGRKYRLPTEAEWEYACRAGTTTAYSFGDDPTKLAEYAWTKEIAGGRRSIGRLKANPWGLFDMHGNMFEWCGDRHDYANGRSEAGLPVIARGGSWHKPATDARSAYRGLNLPKSRYADVGFRVVCEFSAPKPLEVPKRAADILPFIQGTWKYERVIAEPKLPPDQVRSAGYQTFDAVASGKVMRGISVDKNAHGTSLILHSYESGTGRLNSWYFSPEGDANFSSAGVFNPAKRTFLWMEGFPDGTQSHHEMEFVDANTVNATTYDRNAANAIVYHSQVTFTRTRETAPAPKPTTDPKRPDEMKGLDKLVGEWQTEITVKPAVETWRTVARPILGGRFIEMIGTNDAARASDYAIVWYDPTAKTYRQWYFNSQGHMMPMTGTWDATTNTLNWQTADKSKAGRWTFKENQREFQHVIVGADGKVVSEATGTSVRAEPPAKK